MLWLGLHFPNLGLEVFAEPSASLCKKSEEPTVLLQDNRVVLGNVPAHNAGIVCGVTLATAHSIVPQLRHYQRDTEKEALRLAHLGQALYRFSSHVSLVEPGNILLEVQGSQRLFGDLSQVQTLVIQACTELGHQVQPHLGRTPLAATLLARSPGYLPQQSKRQGGLADVALAHTDLSDQWVERCANMGLRKLGDLLALPNAELGQRFGSELVAYLQRIVGELPDPRAAIAPTLSFARELHLLDAVRSKQALQFPMARLLNELQHWLIGRQLGVEALCWHFTNHSGAASTLLQRFAAGKQNPKALLEAGKQKLERCELPEDILSIQLKTLSLSPWQPTNRGLFPEHFLGAEHLLGGEPLEKQGADLVDQLCARLGERACYGIQTQPRHRPEEAWAKVNLLGCDPRRKRRKQIGKRAVRKSISAAPELHCPKERPLWLFDPPRAIPAEQLTLLRGPERIRSHWWHQALWRDYYIAQHSNGAQCWAFVDAQKRWYLHGYFA